MPSDLTRRTFLGASAAGLAATSSAQAQERIAAPPRPGLRSKPPERPNRRRRRLAVVTTAYYYLSHAYHVCGRFLYGYLRDGRYHWPDWSIAGMYCEQQRQGDLSRELAKEHGFTISKDVAGALTLGGDTLAVDGVLLIGEHGDYPYNEKGQKLYPRYELFQQIVAVFRKTGRVVPVFNDKHLYYDRKRAAEMVQTARKMNIPMYAGSSLPITWRRPEVELPLGGRIREALVASRGEIEIFGIHALEALQCMIERRLGATPGLGRQGVVAVQCLEGEAVWKAGDAGVWSWDLLEHALGRSPSRNVGDIRVNCRHFAPPPGRPSFPRGPIAFLIEYADGLRATVLLLNGHVDDTTFAAHVEGQRQPVSTLFHLPPPPGAAFLEALSWHVEQFMNTGRPPYPVERTLLTGGILDVALESRVRQSRRLETPELDIRYDAPKDSGFMRGEYAAPVA